MACLADSLLVTDDEMAGSLKLQLLKLGESPPISEVPRINHTDLPAWPHQEAGFQQGERLEKRNRVSSSVQFNEKRIMAGLGALDDQPSKLIQPFAAQARSGQRGD